MGIEVVYCAHSVIRAGMLLYGLIGLVFACAGAQPKDARRYATRTACGFGKGLDVGSGHPSGGPGSGSGRDRWAMVYRIAAADQHIRKCSLAFAAAMRKQAPNKCRIGGGCPAG